MVRRSNPADVGELFDRIRIRVFEEGEHARRVQIVERGDTDQGISLTEFIRANPHTPERVILGIVAAAAAQNGVLDLSDEEEDEDDSGDGAPAGADAGEGEGEEMKNNTGGESGGGGGESGCDGGAEAASEIARLEELAERGDVDARMRAAELLIKGSFSAEADERAIIHLTRASLSGRGDAMARLSKLYEKGTRFTPKDEDSALHWLERASLAGHLDSNKRCAMDIPGGIARRARHIIRRAELIDEKAASVCAFNFLCTGRYVPRNLDQALEHLEKLVTRFLCKSTALLLLEVLKNGTRLHILTPEGEFSRDDVWKASHIERLRRLADSVIASEVSGATERFAAHLALGASWTLPEAKLGGAPRDVLKGKGHLRRGRNAGSLDCGKALAAFVHEEPGASLDEKLHAWRTVMAMAFLDEDADIDPWPLATLLMEKAGGDEASPFMEEANMLVLRCTAASNGEACARAAHLGCTGWAGEDKLATAQAALGAIAAGVPLSAEVRAAMPEFNELDHRSPHGRMLARLKALELAQVAAARKRARRAKATGES